LITAARIDLRAPGDRGVLDAVCRGTLDLNQFRPFGNSDGDTAYVQVKDFGVDGKPTKVTFLNLASVQSSRRTSAGICSAQLHPI